MELSKRLGAELLTMLRPARFITRRRRRNPPPNGLQSRDDAIGIFLPSVPIGAPVEPIVDRCVRYPTIDAASLIDNSLPEDKTEAALNALAETVADQEAEMV
jgi:hypothetical protein